MPFESGQTKSTNIDEILVIGIIYFYRREQSKKITEDVDKARIENIDVFYSYLVSLILVTLVVLSAILSN